MSGNERRWMGHQKADHEGLHMSSKSLYQVRKCKPTKSLNKGMTYIDLYSTKIT